MNWPRVDLGQESSLRTLLDCHLRCHPSVKRATFPSGIRPAPVGFNPWLLDLGPNRPRLTALLIDRCSSLNTASTSSSPPTGSSGPGPERLSPAVGVKHSNVINVNGSPKPVKGQPRPPSWRTRFLSWRNGGLPAHVEHFRAADDPGPGRPPAAGVLLGTGSRGAQRGLCGHRRSMSGYCVPVA